MKKIAILFAAVAALFATASCEPKDKAPVAIKVQLVLDGQAYAQAGVKVTLTESAVFEAQTDSLGAVEFTVPEGLYKAEAAFKAAEGGELVVLSGSADIQVAAGSKDFELPLNKVVASQIIIKEFYSTQCVQNDGTKFYSNDAYVTLYNNTDTEADASDIVFGVVNPGNAHAPNKWIVDGKLAYEDLGYVPAYSGMWFFQSPVKIAPYSSLTVAIFGAIDHTQTVANSVDLSKPEYYVMAKEGVTQLTNAKYQIAETIDKSHYLSAYMWNLGNAWVLSNSAPAFFIGKMSKAELEALVNDTENYDVTAGATNVLWAPKFPTSKIVDCVECWDKANADKSNCRFPASVNAGPLAITIKAGHTFYRNVDKEATEALAENEGKLVYNYAGGTEAEEGSTDPSGIDAEASLKAGAHIVFADTNNTGKDFHERKVSALK